MARQRNTAAASMTSTAPNSPAPICVKLADDLTDTDCGPELSRLGRTLGRWHHQIINWHQARVTNGPTEAVIICSASEGVVDVADRRMAGCGGRVIWSGVVGVRDVAVGVR